jgi:hypothetical protein
MPIDPKSYLYLGGACVAAIAAVGSVFELSSGDPQLGTLVTGTILTLSVPLSGFFFFAAIRNAQGD